MKNKIIKKIIPFIFIIIIIVINSNIVFAEISNFKVYEKDKDTYECKYHCIGGAGNIGNVGYYSMVTLSEDVSKRNIQYRCDENYHYFTIQQTMVGGYGIETQGNSKWSGSLLSLDMQEPCFYKDSISYAGYCYFIASSWNSNGSFYGSECNDNQIINDTSVFRNYKPNKSNHNGAIWNRGYTFKQHWDYRKDELPSRYEGSDSHYYSNRHISCSTSTRSLGFPIVRKKNKLTTYGNCTEVITSSIRIPVAPYTPSGSTSEKYVWEDYRYFKLMGNCICQVTSDSSTTYSRNKYLYQANTCIDLYPYICGTEDNPHNWEIVPSTLNKITHTIKCSKCNLTKVENHNCKFKYDGIDNNLCKCGYIDKVNYHYILDNDNVAEIHDIYDSMLDISVVNEGHKTGYLFDGFDKYEYRITNLLDFWKATASVLTQANIEKTHIGTYPDLSLEIKAGIYSTEFVARWNPIHYSFKFNPTSNINQQNGKVKIVREKEEDEEVVGHSMTYRGDENRIEEINCADFKLEEEKMTDQDFIYDQPQNLKDEWSVQGYTMEGWYKADASGNVDFDRPPDFGKKGEVLNATVNHNDVIEVYPKFEEKHFFIDYDCGNEHHSVEFYGDEEQKVAYFDNGKLAYADTGVRDVIFNGWNWEGDSGHATMTKIKDYVSYQGQHVKLNIDFAYNENAGEKTEEEPHIDKKFYLYDDEISYPYDLSYLNNDDMKYMTLNVQTGRIEHNLDRNGQCDGEIIGSATAKVENRQTYIDTGSFYGSVGENIGVENTIDVFGDEKRIILQPINQYFMAYRNRFTDLRTAYKGKNSADTLKDLEKYHMVEGYKPVKAVATTSESGMYYDRFNVDFELHGHGFVECDECGAEGDVDFIGIAELNSEVNNGNLTTCFELGKEGVGRKFYNKELLEKRAFGRDFDNNYIGDKLVKDNGYVTFYPYVKMAYATTFKIEKMPVYICSQNESKIADTIIVDTIANTPKRDTLQVRSNWVNDSSAMQVLANNNVVDKESVANGGSIIEIHSRDSRDKDDKRTELGRDADESELLIDSYVVCIPDGMEEKFGKYTYNESEAQEELFKFRASVEDTFSNYYLEQWVANGIYTDEKEFKNNAVCVDGYMARDNYDGIKLNKTQDKYYFNNKLNSNNRNNKIDLILQDEELNTYSLLATTTGDIVFYKNGDIIETLEANKRKNYSSQSIKAINEEFYELNETTGFIDNFMNSLDFGLGEGGRESDRNGKIIKEGWYNEAIDGVSLVKMSLVYKPFIYDMKYECIDPALCGKLNSVYDLWDDDMKKWRTMQFRLSNRAYNEEAKEYGEENYIGTIGGMDVVVKNIDDLLSSKLFYIGNGKVDDSKM